MYTRCDDHGGDRLCGNFVTKVKSDRGVTEIKHGATVIAVGADVYKPTEYLYGEDDRVMTHLELEEQIAKGERKGAQCRKPRDDPMRRLQK
jgi:heterodisulfide reductase subunit A-like polyferredoxin